MTVLAMAVSSTRSYSQEAKVSPAKPEALLADKAKALAERDAAVQRSEGYRLAVHSAALLSENPELALLLAIEGARRAPGQLVNDRLFAALRECRAQRTLRGHEGPVSLVSFSPDGERVLTASEEDGTARIWDAETGRELFVLKGTSLDAYSASFSPDGKQVVTGSLDGTVRTWDAATGRQVQAQKSLGRLQTALKQPKWPSDNAAAMLQSEAKALLAAIPRK